jgi:hypothetical protein
MQLDEKYGLRGVELAEVAEYLRCDPKRLQIALEHLAASPTVIFTTPKHVVTIAPIDRILNVVGILARIQSEGQDPEVKNRQLCKDIREVVYDSACALTTEEITRRVNEKRLKSLLEGQPTLDTSPVDPQVAKWRN